MEPLCGGCGRVSSTQKTTPLRERSFETPSQHTLSLLDTAAVADPLLGHNNRGTRVPRKNIQRNGQHSRVEEDGERGQRRGGCDSVWETLLTPPRDAPFDTGADGSRRRSTTASAVRKIWALLYLQGGWGGQQEERRPEWQKSAYYYHQLTRLTREPKEGIIISRFDWIGSGGDGAV